MKRAFTLIELLVVIAIIAILAAILFPVFAQAKLAAKKTAGLAQAKQIGLALNMYTGDTDDVLPGYRFRQDSPSQNINPTYLDLKAAGSPKATEMEGKHRSSLNCVFFSQLLMPYIKSNDLFKSPGNPEAWYGFQDKGSNDDGFWSYGGQNSYAANNYAFTAVSSKNIAEGKQAPVLGFSQLQDVSNTLLFVDATYYNALPAQPAAGYCKLNSLAQSGSYLHYWKQLGNSKVNFNSPGDPNPDAASNQANWTAINQRFGGVLNVVRADSSAKSINAKKVVNEFRTDPVNSMWNPLKTPCEQ